MLTARDALDDVVQGLKAGADDYLVKPLRMAELAARIRSLERRGRGPTPGDRLPWGPLRVDAAAALVWVNDQELLLTSKEFQLLEWFLRHPGRLVQRSWLLDQLWSIDAEASEETVETHLNNLRRKLRLAGCPEPDRNGAWPGVSLADAVMTMPWRQNPIPRGHPAKPLQRQQLELLGLYLLSLAGILLVFAAVVRKGFESIVLADLRSQLVLIGEDFSSLPMPAPGSERDLQASHKDFYHQPTSRSNGSWATTGVLPPAWGRCAHLDACRPADRRNTCSRQSTSRHPGVDSPGGCRWTRQPRPPQGLAADQPGARLGGSPPSAARSGHDRGHRARSHA
jgi:DNA-binding CsgD family transcriptional regulator